MAEEKKQPETTAEGPELITLEDDNGTQVTFEIVDEADCEGGHYIAAVQYEENNSADDNQMIILQTGNDEDGEFYDIVDDDEQLLKLGKFFQKRLDEKYDIRS